MKKKPAKKHRELNDTVEQRAVLRDMVVRAKDEDNNSAVFVAATDSPVDTFFGPEILLMSGLDSERFEKNPVILNAHNSHSIENIIGRGVLTVQKHELEVEIFFAVETELGLKAWELVKGDFLRTLSVGFLRKKAIEIEEGSSEKFKKDDLNIEGHAVVVTEWELFEISAVPVPADADALKREYSRLRATIINEGTEMTKKPKIDKDAMDASDADKDQEPVTREPDTEPVADPTLANANTKSDPKLGEMVHGVSVVPVSDEVRAEIDKLEAMKIVNQQIREITPDTMTDFADNLIAQGKPLAEARELISAAITKRMKPVGTGEPVKPGETDTKPKKEVDGKGIKKIFA